MCVTNKVLLFIFLILLSSYVVGAYSTNKIVRYYSFDNANLTGATVIDWAIKGNATNNPAATTGIAGIIGEAFNFTRSESDRVAFSGVATMPTGSVSYWWKPNQTSLTIDFFYNGGVPTTYLEFRANNSVTFISSTGVLKYFSYVIPSSAVSAWQHHVMTWDGTDFRFYVNGTLQSTTADAGSMFNGGNSDLSYSDPGYAISGGVDEFSIWNETLNATDVETLYNNGNGCNPYVGCYSVGATTDLYITAADEWNSTAINSFSANITWSNGTTTTHSSSGGNIYLSNLSNGGTTYNIIFWNATNYYTKSYSGLTLTNATNNTLQGNLSFYYRIYSTTYSNYVAFGGVNYTRNLSYSINLTCPDFINTNIGVLFNSSVISTVAVSCNNSSQIIMGTHNGTVEGAYTFGFYYNSSGLNQSFGNQSFKWDVNSPTATGNFTRTNGFNNHTTNVSSRCYDNIFPNLNLTTTFNGAVLFDSNATNNTHISNASTLTFGLNTLNVTCRDPWSTSVYLEEETVYPVTLYLIDEKENTIFNVANISGARVYFDDNSSYYDFKTAGTNATNFTGIGTEKLRFELTYASGDIITRYVDVTLFNNSAVKVCANKEGVTHYEQLLISSVSRPVFLTSVFSNCVIAADYTRFAYQDSYLLKAYSIATMYYLYVYDGAAQILLASVDGSISTYMNLDTLEFSQNAYDLAAYGQGLGIEKVSNTEVLIAYQNLQNDNVNASIIIQDVSTSTTYLSTTATNPNNFTLYFDWTTLNVTNTTLFQVAVTTTDADGNVNTIKQYINVLANTGTLTAGVGFAIALLLTIFGLTMTAARYALGWFGAAVLIAAVAVLALSVSTWYVLFLMVIDIILLIFVIIVFLQQNYHVAVS